jgi:hypothetical protein
VTWEDAKVYVEWLAKKTGKPYVCLSEVDGSTGRDLITPAGWGLSAAAVTWSIRIAPRD